MKQNFFKRLMAVALVLCMVCTMALSVSAVETSEYSASVNLSVSRSGNTITAVVSLSSTNVALAGTSFNVNFDNTKVSLTSAAGGSIFGFNFNDSSANSNGYVRCVGDTNSATTTTGTLVTLNFTILDGATGDASFSLSNVRCADADAYTFNGTATGGGSIEISDYKINLETPTNGTISSSATSSSSGKTITLTTAPAAGYAVDTVTVIGSNGATIAVTSSGNTHTFTMPKANVTVSATFKSVPYTVTAGSVTNGKLVVDKTAANVGETVTVTATPNEGFEIASVTATGATLSGGTNGVYTFTMPAANVTVNATFKAKSYTITKSAVTNGTLSVSGSAGVGDTVKITATPAAGYKLTKVTVTDASGKAVTVSGSGSSYTFKMPAANVTVAAEFEKVPYTVTLNKTYNGTASVDKTGGYYGETVTVTVKANDYYDVEYVSVLDSSNKNVSVKNNKNGTYTFTMPASNVKISVGFKGQAFNISLDNPKNGTVKVASTGNYNSNVEFTVEADEGYELDSLKVTVGNREVTVNKENGVYSFKMPAGKVSIKATFKAVAYKVSVKAAENGTFNVSADTANIGDVIKVTATPDDTYQVNAVVITDSKGNLVSYTGEGENFTFEMPNSDVTVEVTFEKIPDITYGITVNAAQNGKVTVSKDTAGAGSVVTITCTPDEGYLVDTVTVTDAEGNAVEVSGSENVFAFAMPENDATVSVSFKEDPNFVKDVPTTAPVVEEEPPVNITAWIIPGAILLLIVAIMVMIIVILTKKKK